MGGLFDSLISIGTMAAFIDSNLSDKEMQEMSSMIENDESLKNLMDANSVIDESMSALAMADTELPQELQTLDFELPVFEEFHVDSDIFVQDEFLK